MRKIRVALKERSYQIIIGRNLIGRLGLIIKPLDLGKTAVIVTNSVIRSLYGKKLQMALNKARINCRFVTIPPGEKAKSIKWYISVIEKVARLDKRQDAFLAALGGGVVGDLTGFAAATYKRGIPYIQIPTTLLAQVDSAIGGKTAIDMPIAKNIVGAFYQPRCVIADVSVLRSLPSSEIRAGLAEVIKYGVIKDEALFRFVEGNLAKILRQDASSLEYVISRCAGIKANIVAADEFDKKEIRLILNFGHTLGHAIESASGYKGYVHGEAVAIGMLLAASIASRMGIFNSADLTRLEQIVKNAGLPLRVRKTVRLENIIKAYRHDKKIMRGINRFILPVSIGQVKVARGLPEGLIRASLLAKGR